MPMQASHVQLLSGSTLLLTTVLLLWRCYLLAMAVRSLRAQCERARQDERRRIAADIHDDLGQNLLTLKLDLATLRRQPVRADQAAHLERMSAHIDVTSRSLRAIINGLHPVALEQGLRCAVERQLHEFARANGIEFNLEDTCYHSDGAGPAEATVLRVLQESLSNIARHAQASEVRIALARDENQLSLTVHDNGVGMPDGPVRRGLGLMGMERRVADAGGWLALASTPGHGTALTVAVPNARGFAQHQACQ
ncbi:sensor histidine kinase [Duganella sp. FT92W]|uniref:Oxygen sensor histidine kinase NreB n=2 Tax=Pseudoduganella rivuli TaxID=2666085 RepID=A0A7X2LV09_9BURK|nr:sensor histidine kinase [Pseudoduganella rivuli]